MPPIVLVEEESKSKEIFPDMVKAIVKNDHTKTQELIAELTSEHLADFWDRLVKYVEVSLTFTDKSGRILEKVVQGGVDINHKDSQGRTPLYRAANTGDFTVCSMLVSHGADASSAIDIAIRRSNFQLVDMFVQNGADFDLGPEFWVACMNKNVLLFGLAKAGATKAVDLLLDEFELQGFSIQWNEALICALKNRAEHCAALLIIRSRHKDLKFPLEGDVEDFHQPTLYFEDDPHYIIAFSSRAPRAPSHGRQTFGCKDYLSCFHMAISNDFTKLAELLIQRFPTVLQEAWVGEQPLPETLRRDKPEFVEWMLENRPASLKSLARQYILNHLGSHAVSAIEDSALPTSIKSYLIKPMKI